MPAPRLMKGDTLAKYVAALRVRHQELADQVETLQKQVEAGAIGLADRLKDLKIKKCRAKTKLEQTLAELAN